MNVVHRNPGEVSGSTGNNFELRLCVLVFVIFSEITTIPLRLGSGRRDVEQFYLVTSMCSGVLHNIR